MKKLLLYLFLLGMVLNTQQAGSQTLNCKLNIGSNGKYLQVGAAGGNSERWVMKGTHSCITHYTPDAGDPTGWEGGSHIRANWDNKDAQLNGMKAAGINTVRFWMPAPLGRDNPNPSFTGTTMNQHFDELVQYIVLCKTKGLWVVVEDWWGAYLMAGNTDAYYDSGEWHDKMLDFIHRIANAGCDNVMFGTGNEPGQMTSQFGIQWQGNWKDNTKKMIAGYRRLGYTGPVLADVSGWDNQPGDVNSFAEIQNSDPAKNVGFQEHEYWNWNGAANGYNYLPVCRAAYNSGMACENFPMFMTESAFTADWNVDAMKNLAVNNNWGGGCYFWYNNFSTACTANGDGINLNAAGIQWRDRFWNVVATGIPAGFYPTGPTVNVTGISSVTPANATITTTAGTVKLSANVTPTNATDQAISWTSSNTGIATVDGVGNVTAVSNGASTITAKTHQGNYTSSTNVTVNINTQNYTAIPAKIEAESYTSMFGIATEACSDAGGGLDVGYTDPGDYMNYNVNATAGTYTVDVRVASPNNGSQIQIKNGSTVLATINIPNTGGWQNWTTVTSSSFNLAAGPQTLQVYAVTNGWNINWLEFKSGGNVAVTGISVSPYPFTLNGIGSTQQLTASVSPSNATNKNVTWSTTNSSIVTVTSTGLITAIAAGNATVSAKSTDGTNITGSSNITVVPTASCTNPTVSNSAFENGNTSGWAGSYGSVSATTSSPHSGSYCGQVSGTPGAFDQTVSGLNSNKSYTLTAWVKVSSGDEIRLGAKNFGGSEINTPVTSTGWTQVSVNFTTGSSNTSTEIYAWHSSGSGTVWVDDVSITCNGLKSALATKTNSIASGIQLNAYPNPVTNGLLNIRLDGQTEDATVQIYTIVGKLEYSNILRNNETKQIENLPAGMYLIKVSGNNITETRKVLVR